MHSANGIIGKTANSSEQYSIYMVMVVVVEGFNRTISYHRRH